MSRYGFISKSSSFTKWVNDVHPLTIFEIVEKEHHNEKTLSL